MSLYCDLAALKTESDVEQKFIYPFLSSSHPLGLGYSPSDILTKHILRQHLIGKGRQKYYYPDYLITLRGIPLIVVEAKSPGEDLETAYSEARLYCAEINAVFPHNVNVCSRIIVSNGVETWAGFSDDATPIFKIEYGMFVLEGKSFVDLVKFCSKEDLVQYANYPYINMRGKARFSSPVSALGGSRVQDEELVENTYGRTLVFENRNIFDPDTESDKIDIVANAYITSAKRDQHIEPLYKEIRKLQLPSEVNTTLIATENPLELVNGIEKNIALKDYSYSLILLIGIVGSGKTTFIRYFKEIILKEQYSDLYNKCEWIFINMNPAPVDRAEIYAWIKEFIIKSITENHTDINFSEIASLRKIFSYEIKDFEDGIGSILKSDKESYNREFFAFMRDLLKDKEKCIMAYIRFIKSVYHKVPIIVLDNCDKRNKDEQLLLFEVGQWIKDNYKCIVILPMRDSTYDLYKNEPPLDTVVKDLVFRIDASDLLRILQARLNYIYRINKNRDDFYELENGMSVLIKRDEQIEYFRCILLAIRNNKWVLNIFYKLTNKNIRAGIQLFEDLCKSGHISSEEIFKIRTTDDYELSNRNVINALLRKNRKYFSETKSNFINIFNQNFNDDFPDPFVRVDILLWLRTRLLKSSSISIKGYHKIEMLVRDLQNAGHNEETISREIRVLISRGLVFSETMSSNVVYDDLIKLSPSGSLHLFLLSNLNYLAACAEDVVYKNTEIMMQISRRIATKSYLDRISTIFTAKNMVDYLVSYRKEFLSRPEFYIKEGEYTKIYDMNECIEAIANAAQQDNRAAYILKILDIHKNGMIVECKIVYKSSYFVLGIFGDKVRGYISTGLDYCNYTQENHENTYINDMLRCSIIDFDISHMCFHLRYLGNIKDEHSVNNP